MSAPGRPRLPALLACAGVLALAIALRVAWFPVTARSPDEQLWTQFGSQVAAHGPGWITQLSRRFAAGEDVDYSWPHRGGYVCLIGLVMRLSDRPTVETTEAVSAVASVLLIALAGAIAIQYFGPLTAAVAMLFLAVSPLDLALARRAWQDDPLALVTLLMVATALGALTRPRPGAWRAAFFAISAYALLFKESAAIPFGLGAAGLAGAAWRDGRDPRRALGTLALGALAAAAAGAALLLLCGGWTAMRSIYELAREYTAPDDYMREYQTGGIGYYVTGLGILQPLPWLLGYAGAALAIARPRLLARPWAHPGAARVLFALGIYVAGFSAVSFAYFSKNMRFLSPIYAPIALLAAALVAAALSALRARLPRPAYRLAAALVALTLLGFAVRDALRFDHYFNEIQIQDLATPWFTKADAGKL